MIVIDSSAIIEVLLQTRAASRIEPRIFASGETLHAPQLIDLEVAQVLRRYCTSGELNPNRGREAVADFSDFPITRYPHDIFLPRIWELRQNLTAYDAIYVALAEILSVPLLTRDKRLSSAPGHSAMIELI
jgi:predicted nucleic acid-binding protein